MKLLRSFQKITSSDGYTQSYYYFVKGNSHKTQGGNEDFYSVKESAKKYFTITPNPIVDNFQLNFPNDFKGDSLDDVEIWDNFGKKVKHFKNVSNQTIFDASNFMGGMYFIRMLHKGEFIESKKIIVQK